MENSLQHHGILGQRWGVRRYQNEDGSLTAAGKKKYALKGFTEDSLNSNKTKLGRAYDRLTDAHKYGGEITYHLSSQKERDRRAEQYVKEHNIGKKNPKAERKKASKNRRNLSDADLKKQIERMKLEKEMKDLTDADLSPGKKFINEVLSTSGKRVATTVVTGATLYAIKASLEGNIDFKEAAGYVAPRPKNK